MYFFWHSSNGAVTWASRTIGLETWLQQKSNEFLSFLFMMTGLFLRLMLVFFYFSLLNTCSLLSAHLYLPI
jgi:CysZ protein